MAKKFDLIVVGGGTSGLEAAKTAAENGLTVALLERKTDPGKIQRSCAQMFLMNMDSFYNERMYFSRETKKWVFPVNNFTVNYPGTYREFYGCHFIAPNAEDRIEIGDYEANASGRESRQWFLTRVFCWAVCMPRGKRQALPIILSAT